MKQFLRLLWFSLMCVCLISITVGCDSADKKQSSSTSSDVGGNISVDTDSSSGSKEEASDTASTGSEASENNVPSVPEDWDQLGNVLILGDSYSAFPGYIPDGYATWYTNPDSETDLDDVSYMW